MMAKDQISDREFPKYSLFIGDEFRQSIDENQDIYDLIVTCSFLRWFDVALMASFSYDSPKTPDELVDRLKHLPFCEENPVRGYCFDHDFINFFLQQDEVKDQSLAVHGRAAAACRQLADRLSLKPVEWFDHPDWKTYAAEWIYHLAWTDPEQALQHLTNIFAEAFAVLVTARKEVEFCYELFNRIDFDQLNWPEESAYAERIRYLRKKLKVLLAYQDKDALDLLEELAKNPDLTDEKSASIYQWIGSTQFRDADRFGIAKERLETAYKLNPHDWLINAELSAFHAHLGALWGRIDLAREYAHKAVRADEKNNRGFVQLGNICQILGDWEGALEWYEKARQLEPQSVDALLGLSEVYAARRRTQAVDPTLDVDDVERAAQLIEQSTAISPNISYFALIRKGNAYRDAFHFAEAQEAYEAAISENSDRADAYIELGRLFITQDQSRQAEEQYRLAIKKEPNASAYVDLAGIFGSQGKYEAAVKVCREALEQGINSLQLQLVLSDYYKFQEDWDGMEASWKAWMAYDPGSAYLAHCLMGAAYKEKAWQQRSAQEMQDYIQRAQAQYDQAREIDPNLAGAHISLANLAILQKDDEKYQAQRQFVEEHTPWATYDLLVSLGEAKTKSRLFEDAKELLDSAVKEAPQRNDARFALVELFQTMGNEDGWLQAWDEIVQMDPALKYRKYLELGDLYSVLIAYDEARNQYTEAVNELPDMAAAYLRLAYLYEKEGRGEEARKFFSEARERASAFDTEALAKISILYSKNLMFEKAESNARKALFSDPELIYGYIALAWLGVKSDQEEIIAEALAQLNVHRPQLVPELKCEIAYIYLNVEDISKAEEAFLSCIQEYEKRGIENAEAYLGRAVILVRSEKFDLAEELFNRALDLMDPDEDFQAHLDFGNAYEKVHRLSEAEDHYRQAAAIFPDNPDGHIFLGSVYREQGRMTAAREAYRAAKMAGGVEYYDLGVYYENIDKFEDALVCFHLGLENGPDEPRLYLYYHAGLLHAFKEEWPEAQSNLRSAIQEDPDQPEPYLALIQMFMEQDQLADAEQTHQQMAARTGLAFDAHLSFGEILQDYGQIEQAEQVFKLAIQIDPQNSEGYLSLRDLLLQDGRIDDAILVCQQMAQEPELTYIAYISLGRLFSEQVENLKSEEYYRKAIDLKPDQVDAYLLLAFLYLNMERFRDAEQMLLKALEIEADNPDVIFGLAAISERQEQFDKAIQYYRKIFEIDTDAETVSQAFTSIGRLLLSQGKYQEAVDALQNAGEKDPTNAEALLYLGQANEALDNLNVAALIYTQASNLNPRFGEVYIALGRVYGKLHITDKVAEIEKKILTLELGEEEIYPARLVIATSYAEAGARKRAEAAYRDLIQMYPDLPDAYMMLADRLADWEETEKAVEVYQQMAEQPDLYYQSQILLGDLQASEELFDQAELSYRRAIAASRDISDPYIYLAQMFLDQNRVEAAVDLMLEMSKQPDLTFIGYLNMGVLWQNAEKYDEAEKAFLDAIQQEPENINGYLALAYMYQGMNRLEDAIIQTQKALAIYPADVDANSLMADLLEQKGDFLAAIQIYQHVTDLDLGAEIKSAAFMQIGKLYLSLGDNQQAHEALRIAVKENPSNAEAYYVLGNVFELQEDGGLERAKEAYEETISLAPYFSEAYVALGRVYGSLDDIQGLHLLTRKIDEMELPPEERYVGYLVIGAAYREGNFPDWATEAYNKAMDLDPDRVEAYRELGLVLSNERRWNSALLAFERALKVAKPEEKSELHANIGFCYSQQTKNRPVEDPIRQENENKAEQAYKKAIELSPNQDSAYRLLSELYETQGRWDEAIQVYTEMGANAPFMTSSAYLNIGVIHRKLGQWEQMRQAIQIAIQSPLEPNSPVYFDLIRRRGLAHFMISEYEQAEEYLSQAISKNTYDFQARFYHALNLLSMNHQDEAWEELEKGIGMTRDEGDFRYVIEEARVLADRQPEIPGSKNMLRELLNARRKLEKM